MVRFGGGSKRCRGATAMGSVLLVLLTACAGTTQTSERNVVSRAIASNPNGVVESLPADPPERGRAPDSTLEAFPAPSEEIQEFEILGETSLPVVSLDQGEQEPLWPDAKARFLDSASHHYELAKKHWKEGRLPESRAEIDLALRDVVLMPGELEVEEAKLRESLKLGLAKLVVTMEASKGQALAGGSTEIPLVMNDWVRREIKSFQNRERRFFLESYHRAGSYLPRIRKKLAEHHMPSELAWLPLIESGFKVRALSRARALGLWQFIPSTGYRFGLKRDSWVDQRMDPDLATDAAIAYLQQLHGLFGDWSTALAAYNCGEGNVARAIRRQKVNYLDDFWDLFRFLPYETARYVPRFYATLYIIQDPAAFGFDDLGEPGSGPTHETFEMNKQVHLKSIAAAVGVSQRLLKKLNPSLRYSVTPPRKFGLRVPMGTSGLFAAKLPSIKPHKLTRYAGASRYRVRRGDTLSKIAQRFRVSIRAIVRLNRLRSRHFLRIGQVLRIPQRGA